MKAVYLLGGMYWPKPGVSRYVEYGPYTTIQQGRKETSFVQGNLFPIRKEVPDWFFELVEQNPDNQYLRTEGKKLGLL